MKALEKYPDWFIIKLALNNINDTLNMCEKSNRDDLATAIYKDLKAEFENAYNLAREERGKTQ